MRTPFEIVPFQNSRNNIVPNDGEEMGNMLREAAEARRERAEANPDARKEYWGPKVAQLYMLAAQAYELGASVTIGHKRADRYEAAAEGCRKIARELCGEG